MNHIEKRFRRKNSLILLIIIIMILLLLGGVLLIRYQAHHQIGGLSRKPVISLKGGHHPTAVSRREILGPRGRGEGLSEERHFLPHSDGFGSKQFSEGRHSVEIL